MKINLTESSRVADVDFNNIPFGKVCSDHMFISDYVDGEWRDSRIVPLEPLVLHPANMTLHYGQAIFEGMKASVTKDGIPLLLRPEMHAQRLNFSARRMCMPEFPEDLYVEAVQTLVSIDKAWVPPSRGSALYIRPYMIATDNHIGVRPSETYSLMIITLPVGPYYDRPVSLITETTYVRAANGGVGEAKCAGNYAASLYPAKLAREKGYNQVLWLDAREFKYVQEVGTMNIFFVIDEKVVTPTTTGSILKGVTRDCTMQIIREQGIEIEERRISIDEVIDAFQNGMLREVFGTGTAALVANVERITHKDVTIDLSPNDWSVSLMVKEEINGLRDGSVMDTRNWMVPVTEEIFA